MGWDPFPFEGDLLVKRLDDPVLPEPPRRGEGGADCPVCARPDDAYVWAAERWRSKALTKPRMPYSPPLVPISTLPSTTTGAMVSL